VTREQNTPWPGKADAARVAPTRAAACLVALALTLLTACSAPADPAPVPTVAATATASPKTTPPPVLPDVPLYDAALGAQPAPATAPPPVRLVVPDVGIDMAVDPVGVKDDGEMAIPEDADRAGWYEFGPTPSDPQGSTLVAAHVDSWQTGIGQFAKLRKVAVGSTLTVTTADGTAHGYRVVDVTKVAKEGAPVDQWFDRSGAPRLVLVTCGGAFRRDIGHYTDNVVVTAEPTGGSS